MANGPGGLWVDVWVTGGFILTLILLHALTHTSVCDVTPSSWRGGWLLTERLILRRLKPSVRGVHWLAVPGSAVTGTKFGCWVWRFKPEVLLGK